MICSGKIITDGAMNYEIIGDNLLLFSIYIDHQFPRLCFTDKKNIYLYNYKDKSYRILNSKELIEINNKYHIQDEFYELPKQYVDKYMNNCKK